MEEKSKHQQESNVSVEMLLEWVKKMPGDTSDISIEFKKLAEKYPYSDLMQILYLLSVSNREGEEFRQQLKRTAVHVQNRSRLLELIREDRGNEADTDITPADSKNRIDLLEEFLRIEPRIVPDSESHDDMANHAEESNKDDSGNVSETLARIYAMQGKKEKARLIYEKLGLKYPKKSAYFAALVEKLDKEDQETDSQ